jgi:hypothetical protein
VEPGLSSALARRGCLANSAVAIVAQLVCAGRGACIVRRIGFMPDFRHNAYSPTKEAPMNHSIRIVTAVALFASAGLLSAQQATPTAETATPAPAVEPVAAAIAPETAPVAPEIDRSKLKYSNKWRAKFSGEAKSDGVLVFRMIMKDAEPVVVRVDIKDGTNEDNIADKVEKALKNGFPGDFNVEVDDGESVLVKLNVMEGRCSLELLENTVAKVKVKIKKE